MTGIRCAVLFSAMHQGFIGITVSQSVSQRNTSIRAATVSQLIE